MTVQTVIEWLRIIGGLVGALGIGLGFWMWYRVSRRYRTSEALKEAVDAHKTRADAMDLRLTFMEDENKRLRAEYDDRERELIALRARTDLSEVLKSTQMLTQSISDLVKEQKAHDASMTDVQQKQFDLMSQMLAHIDHTSKDALQQAIESHKMCKDLGTSLGNLSRRFGAVEFALHIVADKVGVPSSDEPPTDRRKKDR